MPIKAFVDLAIVLIDAAIILAGGRGSRLAPWPAPKCLLPVRGVPMIARLVRHVEDHVGRVVVCTGYRADDVEAHFHHCLANALVDLSCAGEDAAMCERLLHAKDEYKIEGRALVCYGDELADVDVQKLEALHEREDAAITFAVHRQALPFGVVHGNCASDRREKRIYEGESVVVNIGFVLAESRAWARALPVDGVSDWVNRVAEAGDRVTCHVHEGRRATVNSLADLERAEEVWR